MVKECMELLAPHAGGVYVDATVGGGGHSLALLQAEPEIRLLCLDQDPEALQRAGARLSQYQDRVDFIRANFKDLRSYLSLRKIKTVSGVLYDLGVSSHQLDTAQRGFSFDSPARLDMRMDPDVKADAAWVVNELPERDLARVIKEYGEELKAVKIARAIVKARAIKPLSRTDELARVVESVSGTGTKESLKAKVRVFQAIRIYVNRELEILPSALEDAVNILEPGGRIVVLAYHSLEDRIVKNIFRNAARDCVCPPGAMHCACGQIPRLKILTGRPLIADEPETKANKRARSAKLRAAEKVQGDK